MSKVVLGFSGGVDSAVSAVLLQRAGFAVHGVYLDNTGLEARREAVEAASRMGVDWKRWSAVRSPTAICAARRPTPACSATGR